MSSAPNYAVVSDDPTLPSGQSLLHAAGLHGPGKLFGSYELGERLGEGRSAVVFAARDSETGRELALKLIRPEADPRREEQVAEELLAKARALARISHPNLIAVHGCDAIHGIVFVAMTRVEGGTLRKWMDAGPLPWPQVLRCFRAAGSGLATAHREGLVHGDFRPNNVLFDGEGGVLVTDFGLTPDTLPADRSPYLSPEQHAGHQADARSDQFSFCVALYRALYGQLPFPGRTPQAMLSAVEEGRVREPRVGTYVPGWLRRVVLRGLAHDPEQRWPNMDALLCALARGGRRRKLAAAAAVLALVALLVALAFLALR